MSQSRLFKLKSLLIHGGPFRAFEIFVERKQKGYSTRSLSYSWPKKIKSHPSKDSRPQTHFLIPHLQKAKAYGGIASLVYWAVKWAQEGQIIHFVICDHGGSKEDIPQIAKLSPQEWDKIKDNFEVSDFSNEEAISLNLHPADLFVASSWWSKASLDQSNLQLDQRNLIYLIQDYEALFYDQQDPVESQLKLLAEESYKRSYKALVNSQFLADYLSHHNKLGRNEVQVFAPLIDSRYFYEDSKISKGKLLFVYARPDVRRNRFDLCVEILKKASAHIPPDWVIVGAGTQNEAVDLGSGHVLRPLGKLSFESYAALLRRSAVGLCLMESPHPSYPPLELGACNALVVCNRFENKDYSILGPQYLCADLDANQLASLLVKAVSNSVCSYTKNNAPIKDSYGTDLISVIVRTHKESQLPRLFEALDSIFQSDYPKVETVLVCKNPSDKTLQELQKKMRDLTQGRPEYSFKMASLQADPQKDTRTQSLNLGLATASGRYLAFLDFDDLIHPKLYSTLIQDLKSKAGFLLSAAGCEVQDVDAHGKISQKHSPFSWGKNLEDLYFENFLPIHSFVIDRNGAKTKDLQFNEELDLYEDYEFLLRLASKYSFSFAHHSKNLATYRAFENEHSNPTLHQNKNSDLTARHKRNDDLVNQTRLQFFPPDHPIRIAAEAKGARFKGHPLKRILKPLFKRLPELENLLSQIAASLGYKARRF